MNNAEDIFLQAAKAAAAMLPELEAERMRLTTEIQRIATKISYYEAMIAGAESNGSTVDNTSAIKPTKGSCMFDIDVSLTAQPTTVKDLQANISKKTGIEYGTSTLYANLQRGLKLRKYANINGRWSKA